MNRRVFLKLTGLVGVIATVKVVHGAAHRLPAAPVAGNEAGVAPPAPSTVRITVPEPGIYRITGAVRLDAPLVEISGMTHAQSISWSGIERPEHQWSSFTAFEHFDQPGEARTLQVRGGQLKGVTAVPVNYT